MYRNLSNALCLAIVALFPTQLLSSPTVAKPFVPFNQSVAEDACNYFSNIAYRDRSIGNFTSIYVVASRRCGYAIRTLRIVPNSSQAAISAKSYLVKLSELKQQLVKMNVSRYKSAVKSTTGTRKISRTVSVSGFFLIAKSIGVFSSGSEFQEIYRTTLYPNVSAQGFSEIERQQIE